jgi:hypothetical protein
VCFAYTAGMAKIEYVRSDAGDEDARKIGSVIRGLNLGEQRLLWQALTLSVLGPMMHDDDDLLHVMFGKRDDGQYRAQVDRKNERCRAFARMARRD